MEKFAWEENLRREGKRDSDGTLRIDEFMASLLAKILSWKSLLSY